MLFGPSARRDALYFRALSPGAARRVEIFTLGPENFYDQSKPKYRLDSTVRGVRELIKYLYRSRLDFHG